MRLRVLAPDSTDASERLCKMSESLAKSVKIPNEIF